VVEFHLPMVNVVGSSPIARLVEKILLKKNSAILNELRPAALTGAEPETRLKDFLK
jgi:hypothetical protein